jgi:hypothetical protein
MALADGPQVVGPAVLDKMRTKWAELSVVLERWDDFGADDRAQVVIFCVDLISFCTRSDVEGALGSPQSLLPGPKRYPHHYY